MEGNVYISSISDAYAIGSPTGPVLTADQPVELLLGNNWITGKIVYNKDNKKISAGEQTSSINVPHTPESKSNDSVTEASEESFPASDPPAWTTARDKITEVPSTTRTVQASFQADSDSHIYDLHEGMYIRTIELTSES